jgi:hypothetical protein
VSPFTLEVIGAVATVLALVAALPSTLAAVRDLRRGLTKARREILDALPAPAQRSQADQQNGSWADDIAYLQRFGTDISELQSGLAETAANSRTYARAIRSLIDEGKIQIALVSGVTDGSHSQIPAGTKFRVPLLFRGGIAPSFRASSAEVKELLDAVWPL